MCFVTPPDTSSQSCWRACLRACTRLGACRSVTERNQVTSHSLVTRCARSFDPCTAAAGPAPGSRCRCSRHSQDVSLSLWQCSDRATHLSTDALPVPRGWREEEEEWDGRGVLWRAVSFPLARSHSRVRPSLLGSSPSCTRVAAASSLSLVRRLVRSLYSTLRISLRLEPRRTSHPAPREPIPTHVEAPTRDAGDDLRSRPNVPEGRRHPCAQPPSLARYPLNPLAIYLPLSLSLSRSVTRQRSLSRPLSRDHVQRP